MGLARPTIHTESRRDGAHPARPEQVDHSPHQDRSGILLRTQHGICLTIIPGSFHRRLRLETHLERPKNKRNQFSGGPGVALRFAHVRGKHAAGVLFAEGRSLIRMLQLQCKNPSRTREPFPQRLRRLKLEIPGVRTSS